jgi:hypothetical protein
MMKNSVENTNNELQRVREENMRMQQKIDYERDEREREYMRAREEISDLQRKLHQQQQRERSS